MKKMLTVLFLVMISTSLFAEPVLKKLKGENIPFSSLKGQWVFINYWASWCESCIGEIPALNQFAKENKKRATVFAVNYDALPTTQQLSLVRQYNILYPSLQNDPAKELKLGDIRGVPVTFVFDPQGRLVETLYGPQSVNSLNRILASD
ncbi:TlpA family protein disulfide reductase [Legionella israelensis]|uniref:Thiol-disulfide oxidoreductase ResA n=1 Tax=Legionella israelensis TaxID=454 RepID=A0A0W0V491_9GAMM|nr:TlpA disulfide reductase family protein [Legionella israelensis]KTD14942.1 thiol-disulfide oxidoreductase ResA [Legionella israelensis]QBS09593.1 TlpA family protein disulfide reductase [Legionella israelensis]SCY23852.1 Thiol-disulfide isomerase or thioredoxin [Legionella israelensis DSM 19235]STX60517.1 thiol-disulfide oxidoreductase [Legionella israelensis]